MSVLIKIEMKIEEPEAFNWQKNEVTFVKEIVSLAIYSDGSIEVYKDGKTSRIQGGTIEDRSRRLQQEISGCDTSIEDTQCKPECETSKSETSSS